MIKGRFLKSRTAIARWLATSLEILVIVAMRYNILFSIVRFHITWLRRRHQYRKKHYAATLRIHTAPVSQCIRRLYIIIPSYTVPANGIQTKVSCNINCEPSDIKSDDSSGYKKKEYVDSLIASITRGRVSQWKVRIRKNMPVRERPLYNEAPLTVEDNRMDMSHLHHNGCMLHTNRTLLVKPSLLM